MLTFIKQLCVRFRSGDQRSRRRRVRQMRLGAADAPESRLTLVATPWFSRFQRIVVVAAALTLFLGRMGQARADLITITAQPTFQTVETASYVALQNGIAQPPLTQTYTTPVPGPSSNTLNVSIVSGQAAASVENAYQSSPSGFTDNVSLSSSAGSFVDQNQLVNREYLSAFAGGSASLQGPTFTLNQPAAATLTFAPTFTFGLNIVDSGNVEPIASATVMLQGNDGSSIQVDAEGDGLAQNSFVYAESVTPGPSSIQTIYEGADSIEMNLAPGTYSISGSSAVGINYGPQSSGQFGLSVSGGAELVLDALGPPPPPTPEPATLTLLGSAVLVFGGRRLLNSRNVASPRCVSSH
jgi:hypothetical protein